jgi:hypothetical protein
MIAVLNLGEKRKYRGYCAKKGLESSKASPTSPSSASKRFILLITLFIFLAYPAIQPKNASPVKHKFTKLGIFI